MSKVWFCAFDCNNNNYFISVLRYTSFLLMERTDICIAREKLQKNTGQDFESYNIHTQRIYSEAFSAEEGQLKKAIKFISKHKQPSAAAAAQQKPESKRNDSYAVQQVLYTHTHTHTHTHISSCHHAYTVSMHWFLRYGIHCVFDKIGYENAAGAT